LIDGNCFDGKRLKGREFLGLRDFDALLESGIRGAFVSTTKVSFFSCFDTMQGNRDVAALCDDVDFLHAVVTFPVNLGSIDTASEYLDLGAKMYRLYFDVTFPVSFLDGTLRQFVGGVSDKKAALIIPYEPVAFGLIENSASAFRDLPLILCGINYPQFRSALGIFESYPNTYMEVSHFSMFNGIEYLARHLGPERLIFGTNWPVFAHRSNVIKLQEAEISEEQRKMIGEDNLIRAVGGLP